MSSCLCLRHDELLQYAHLVWASLVIISERLWGGRRNVSALKLCQSLHSPSQHASPRESAARRHKDRLQAVQFAAKREPCLGLDQENERKRVAGFGGATVLWWYRVHVFSYAPASARQCLILTSRRWDIRVDKRSRRYQESHLSSSVPDFSEKCCSFGGDRRWNYP